MTRQNTKGQQQTSASAEHLDDARRAEAASAKPQSELEKLTSDIIVSLSGGAELPAAKLEDLQKRVEGISDSDRSKLQGSVSKGISHRLAALEVQSKASESQREVAPGEIEQIEKQYRAEADEVARSAVEGLLTESDASALMDALRKQYEKKIKRKGLLAMFKATDLNLRNAVIGILTATGVYKLLSVAQKELLDTYVGEDLEKHVKSLIQEHAEALGLKDVDVDIDDLAVMAMHAKEYMGDQKEQAGDLLHSALEKIPYIGDPRKFGILFDKCRFILLFRKASNSLEVPKRILWQISDMTYAELRDHVDGQDVEGDIYLGLSNVANMIADNRDFLQTELESAVHSLRENPEYKDLEDSDIIELLSEYTIENMTISDILLLKYGSDEERENWLPRSIGRLPALRRAWDLFRGKGYTHFRANMRYAADKLFGMRPGVLNADDLGRLNFTHASQTTQFEEVASEVNRLQDQIKKYTEQLQEQARKPGSFNAELWHERDRLMRKVDFLCDKRCGALFTETANSVLQRGQLVDMLASLTQKGGVSVSEVVAKMPNPSMAQEFIEQALKKGVTQITAAHVPALRAKYLENIVDFNRVKGVWEGAFDNCNRLLTREALPALADAEKAAKLLRRGSSSAAESVIGFRAKSITGKLKYAPKLLIPIGVIGAELYGVSQGNVRWEEFGWDIGEAGAGFVPILGTLLDFKAAIQGTSLSGRKMSTNERWASGLFGVVGAVSDAMLLLGGAGAGVRAGVMGLRTGNKVVRGGRTAVKHGSFLFRMADKISDSFRAFRSAKGLRRVAQVDKAVDFARMADVSHVAGKSASQIARLGDLNALARAGEVSDVAAAGWGLQRFKKGKGAVQKWVAGLLGTDVPDVMRTIDRMDEGIISAQKGVDAAKEAVSVAEKTFESADTISTAKKALFDAERQLELARTLKYADETTDVFRQAQRVKKYKGLDQAARYVTYGGLIGGGVMMLTAGHVEETFDAVTMKGNVTGLVAKPFEMGWGAIWDDHSSVPPIQKAIMARISRRRVLGKLNHLLEETKEKGGDQMRVWYELGVEKGHPWVIAEARNRGIDLESLKAMFVKEGSAMAEAALGDAGQRVRESIG